MDKLTTLQERITHLMGHKILSTTLASFGVNSHKDVELSITTTPQHYLDVANFLKNDTLCQFEQLIDLCGVDYSAYKRDANNDFENQSVRYCVVVHLLSISLNQRIRLKLFALNNDMPVVPSLCNIWSSADWFEREAFDLFGIVFDGHNDLRRILTDYGFIGHPFRKDFPLSGHVEMRYDDASKRVVYQPLTIEPREITPRIIREDGYAGLGQ